MEIQGSPHREDCSSLSLQTRRLGFNINNPLLKLNFTPWSLATCTGARGESCPSRPGRARLYFTLQRKCRENPLSLSWRQYWFVTKSSLPMIVRWETFAGRCMYPTINGFPFLYGDIFFFFTKRMSFPFFSKHKLGSTHSWMYNIVKKPLSTSAHKTFCLRGLRRFKPSLKSPSCVVATITKICTNVTSSPFHKKPSGVFNGEGSF